MLDGLLALMSSSRRLVFTEKQKVILEPFDPGLPAKGEVLIRTRYSLMSTGTENIVFNRLFDPGTHWDKWVQYPFYPGYASVGVVDRVGDGVQNLKAGDRVAFRVGHRSHALVAADACYLIPANVPLDHAVWFPLAKIAFFGARAADYRLGDRCLVVGAGPIGQMSIRWANAAGAASIIVVDSAASRMPLAKAGGASATISEPIGEAREALLAAGGGQLPRVVIDSTGNAAVFAAALGLAGDRGTVVILGDTGQPVRQSLTPDVITRGLTIIGAHDAHNTLQWNDATVAELFFVLSSTGRFPLDGLISHRFQPEQCTEAYETANRSRGETMGILFDWSGDSGAK